MRARLPRLERPLAILAVAVLMGGASPRAPAVSRDGRQGPPFRDFRAVFEAYLGGDADAAVAEFATWTDARVRGEAKTPLSKTEPRVFAALALLHTEAGVRSRAFARPGLGVGSPRDPLSVLRQRAMRPEAESEAHYRAAFDLVTSLTKPAGESMDGLAEFCRRWYTLTISYTTAQQSFAASEALSHIALKAFPQAPGVLVSAGVLLEAEARALPSAPGDRVVTRRGVLGPERFAAEARYRAALQVASNFVEARLRLGRLLQALARNREARGELERALRDAREQQALEIAYLAAVYLGELHEEAGRLPMAESHYRMAVGINPAAVVAPIALGRLLLLQGRVEEGWATARGMFDDRAQAPASVDPWYVADGAESGVVAEQLRALRRFVRP